MANDYMSLGSALYSHINTAATVSVYYSLAPQGATPPYCIFARQSGVDEYTFNDRGVSTDYQLKIISNRRYPAEAMQLYGHVDTALQDGTLSITGYNLLRAQRTTTFDYRDPDGFWHVGGIYRIDIRAT